MRKEIEALKNLIAAMDAEEKARHDLERERQNFFSRQITNVVIDGPITLTPEFNAASEAWAKAFSDLAGARGIAKYLIRGYEAEARATALHPRDEDNGPAARLPT